MEPAELEINSKYLDESVHEITADNCGGKQAQRWKANWKHKLGFVRPLVSVGNASRTRAVNL